MHGRVAVGVVVALAVLSTGRVGASDGGARCGWKPVALPTVRSLDLTAVAARASNDVWIVGTQRGARTVALHYDGRSLRFVPAPTPTPKWDRLAAVATVGARDVWVVGSIVTRPVALHYDGHSWRQVAVPAPAAPYSGEFSGVAGVASNDVWAVGGAHDYEGGDWVGLIEHWDGQRWQIVHSPGKASYNAVAVVSRTNVWAAGIPGSTGPPTAHWDGTSWKLVWDTFENNGSGGGVNAVSASGLGNVWFVGDGPFLERYGGRSFTRRSVPFAHWESNAENKVDSYLNGVAAVAGGGAWAVGNFGIEHYDGHRWTLVSKDTSYVAIAAATPTDIWAVGAKKVIHYTCR